MQVDDMSAAIAKEEALAQKLKAEAAAAASAAERQLQLEREARESLG